MASKTGSKSPLLATFDLVDQHQPLAPVDLDGERRGLARPQPRMALAGSGLDVLRIMIQPANDDQILEPAGDEQFAVLA